MFPDLNFIRSDIDPATVKALDTRDLIRFVNDFLLTFADMLNSFCAKFERRILALEARMDSFERQLILLERKLVDIPGQHAAAPFPSTLAILDDQQRENNNGNDQLVSSAMESAQQYANAADPVPQPEKDQPKMGDNGDGMDNNDSRDGRVPAKEHPVIGKYFRMLRMGVPEPAVKQKMRTEGVDPAILSEPDRLVEHQMGGGDGNGSETTTEDDGEQRQLSSSSSSDDDAGPSFGS